MNEEKGGRGAVAAAFISFVFCTIGTLLFYWFAYRELAELYSGLGAEIPLPSRFWSTPLVATINTISSLRIAFAYLALRRASSPAEIHKRKNRLVWISTISFIIAATLDAPLVLALWSLREPIG